jgi:hypothetical protein
MTIGVTDLSFTAAAELARLIAWPRNPFTITTPTW